MTEEATKAEDQTSEATEDQASTNSESTEETTGKVEPQQDREYLEKLRMEAAKYRKELREAQRKLEALESEKLSETERTKQEAERAKERAAALEARVKRAEVSKAAKAKDFANPELAAKLIDPAKVELDEDGEPVNVDQLLDDLLSEFPDLKASEKKEEEPSKLKQVLKEGDPVPAEKPIYEGEAARNLLRTNPDEFHRAMDEGRIKGV